MRRRMWRTAKVRQSRTMVTFVVDERVVLLLDRLMKSLSLA